MRDRGGRESSLWVGPLPAGVWPRVPSREKFLKAWEAERKMRKYVRGAAWQEARLPETRPARLAVQKAKARDRSHKLRLKKYGLSQDGFDRLHASVAGMCPLCGVRSATAIDHCHRTGVVRGLLCPRCNGALGLFDDDPEALRRAAAYLEACRERASVQ